MCHDKFIPLDLNKKPPSKMHTSQEKTNLQHRRLTLSARIKLNALQEEKEGSRIQGARKAEA